jgi:biotin carboxyl carrier protein
MSCAASWPPYSPRLRRRHSILFEDGTRAPFDLLTVKFRVLDKEVAEKLAAVQAEQRGKQPAALEEKQQQQPQQQEKTRGKAAGSPAPAERKPASKPATKPAAPAAEQPAAAAGAAVPSTGKGMVGKRLRVWLVELGEWKEGKSTSYTKR